MFKPSRRRKSKFISFIIHDFTNPEITKVLDDKNYFNALDEISGSNLTIFYLHLTAEQILSTGKLNIRVSNREELLAIKAGEMEYDELLNRADELIASIEKHYETSDLPEHPDEAKGIKALIEIREELYFLWCRV